MSDKIIKELKNKIEKAVILQLKDGSRITAGIKNVDESSCVLLYLKPEAMKSLEIAEKQGKNTDSIINNKMNYLEIDISLIDKII